MHRWLTAQGVLAVVFLIATGCASAKLNHGGGDGGVGGDDMGGGGPVDLLGLDLTGVDLTGFGGGDQGATNCDVVAQSGCGSGEKCTFGAPDMGNACVSDGTKAIGQACGPSSDDCVHGNICTQENMGGTLLECRNACNSDTDCKQPAAGGVASNKPHCIISFTGTNVKVCTVACQPATNAGASGCATGLGCETFGYAPNPDMGTVLAQGTDCTGMGANGDGASCATNGNLDCTPGYACVNNGTTQKCRQVCRTGNSGDCTVGGGYTCVTPSNITGASWGFCCPGAGC